MQLSREELVQLVETLRRSNVRDQLYMKAESDLLQAGEASVPFLEELLTSSDRVVRERAHDVLRKLRSLASDPIDNAGGPPAVS